MIAETFRLTPDFPESAGISSTHLRWGQDDAIDEIDDDWFEVPN